MQLNFTNSISKYSYGEKHQSGKKNESNNKPTPGEDLHFLPFNQLNSFDSQETNLLDKLESNFFQCYLT